MAPPVTTPPVEAPKGAGPVDTSDAGKGAVAGATGGGPTADAVGGASQLTALQGILSQLVALIQQLTTLLASQAAGATAGASGSGPVQQSDLALQDPKAGGAIAGAAGSPAQLDDPKGGGAIAGAAGSPAQLDDPKSNPKAGGGPDFGEVPPGVVAGANGEIPALPTDTTGGGKITDPTGKSGGPSGPPPPIQVGPTAAQIAARKKAMAAAQKKVTADQARLDKAHADIAQFTIDRTADQAKINALRANPPVGQTTSDVTAQIARLQKHLNGLTSGIGFIGSQVTEFRATLEHDQIALAAVSK